MLVEFSVENYRSIKDKQTLSFVAANGDEHPDNVFIAGIEKIRLLKTLLVYGPNASGKSNLLKAIEACRAFILDSNKLNLNERIKFHYPFTLNEKKIKEPVSFSLEFIADDNIRYKYELKFNFIEIIEEKLDFYPIGNERRLYHRVKGIEIDFGSSLVGEKKSIEKQLLPQHLFLTKAANSNHEQMQRIYTSLIKHVQVMPFITGAETLSLSYVTQAKMLENAIDTNKLLELCKIADPSIFNIGVSEESNSDFNNMMFKMVKSFAQTENSSDDKPVIEQLNKMFLHNTFFNHSANKNQSNTRIFMPDESQGLQKIFGLAPDIIEAIEEGNTLVIDEINSSLHPLIALEIIKMFNSSQANPKNAQLLASTHDVTLLDPDLLRRDQIWFTEKNDDNATELFSLADFPSKEVRKDTPFDKWYLSGKFGAIPVVKDIQL